MARAVFLMLDLSLAQRQLSLSLGYSWFVPHHSAERLRSSEMGEKGTATEPPQRSVWLEHPVQAILAGCSTSTVKTLIK